jgi:hypothetical protein
MVGLTGALLVTRVLALRDELLGVRLGLKREFDQLAADVARERQHSEVVITSARRLILLAERPDDEGFFRVGANVLVAALTTHFMEPPAEWLGLTTRLPVQYVDEFRALDADTQAYLADLPNSPASLLQCLRSNASWTPGTSWLGQGLADTPPIISFDFVSLAHERRSVMRTRWQEFRTRCEPIVTDYDLFRSRMIPGRFYFLVSILAALLVADVIVPMFYLSYGTPDVHVILLGTFVPLCLALVGYFAFEIRRLRAAVDLTRHTVP